ncbi:hypothetical protein KSS93_08420 [Pseudomonas xanthosomatis]|uniref:hypothetical protein n=1 Tax=Pseudomonas xanthosomatis TaxID=2842356 RepID=UPI001C3DF38F|nr:hypothetical protein [Pseudomonas xanthosomatis]QXH47915.1 hypothetical protein KSS93_08420 [Pseudomonas xanthosomatis]
MSELHTQASNFLDFIKTGVDDRTGQFTLALSLPLPPANGLCGPSLNPSLAFSTLASSGNRGFGLGWALSLSEANLDQANPSLQLASGERFAIDLNASSLQAGGQLAFFDQKLKTLLATVQADGAIRIDKKSGERELLRQPDADGARYLLSEVQSAEGRRLFIDWQPFADGDFILDKIRDEQRTLLAVDHADEEVRLTFNPETPSAAEMTLLLSNDRLTSIQLPGIQTPFEVSYDTMALPGNGQLLLPVNCASPLGSRDIVHWALDNDGHQLPDGAPFPFLPRVSSWTHSCGARHSEINHTYTWVGDYNFLGYGSDHAFEWRSGRDNLYQVQGSYQYQAVETQSDASGKTLCSITRHWDRFHLLTREATRQGQCETVRQTRYGHDPDLAWEEQPATCQLPHEITTTYIDHSQPGASRSERTIYRYDDFGNLLHTSYPSGVQERYEYYAAAGEPGCDADTLGMVRHLKKKTVMPAQGPGQAPTLSTRYTYQTLPSLIEGAPAHTVVACEQSHDEASGALLETTEQAYISDAGIHHGREQQTIVTLNGKPTTTTFTYKVEDGALVTETTVAGFENDDENRSSTCSAQSLLSGQTAWERSDSGACTRYEYDSIGRIVRTLHAAGSPFQTEQLARYHLDDSLARKARQDASLNPVMIEQVQATGRRQRQWLDGEGRVVRTELEDLDHAPGVFRAIALLTYDAQGRKVSETVQDWLGDDATAPLSLTTTTAYDDWGGVSLSQSPEGIQSHVRHDPVGKRREQWLCAGQLQGPKQVTLSNTAGSPIEQQEHDDQGRLVRTHTLLRDGLDRVIEQRTRTEGKPDIVTTFTYDHYSRVIEKRLVDGTCLGWAFAAHSDDNHPVAITVTAGTP